jgi:hypothetical protein
VPEPTVEKRSALVGLIFESLRPKGYQSESFAGRKPQPLDVAHIAQIKAFVETSMQELGIPGASMELIDGARSCMRADLAHANSASLSGNDGFEFVVGERAGKRVLIVRDGQHEYVFTEAA